MKKFWKWILANTTDRKVWRVIYDKDGKRTRLLDYDEASNLCEIYGGTQYIDYEYGWF